MARKQISVQADHSHVAQAAAISDGLKKAGMVVQDEIPVLGHFRGLVDEDKIDALKAVPGVSSVNVIGNEGEAEEDDYSVK